MGELELSDNNPPFIFKHMSSQNQMDDPDLANDRGRAQRPAILSRSSDELPLREILRRPWRWSSVMVAIIVTIAAMTISIVLQSTPEYAAAVLLLNGDRAAQSVKVEDIVSGRSLDEAESKRLIHQVMTLPGYNLNRVVQKFVGVK